MPVTAKFSKEFYDRLGHKVADELVDWFNTVDATYRSDFKDLFDAHFGRLDSKWEQRATQIEARLEQRAAQIELTLEQRLGQLEARMIRWMFVFWVGAVGTLVALL